MFTNGIYPSTDEFYVFDVYLSFTACQWQVFGKLIRSTEGMSLKSSGEQHGDPEQGTPAPSAAGAVEGEVPEDPERNNDLREHVVGILFSRSKLTHLQKQVRST